MLVKEWFSSMNNTCILHWEMNSFPHLQITYFYRRNFIIKTVQFLNVHLKIIFTTNPSKINGRLIINILLGT